MASFETAGLLKVKKDTQAVSDKFSKREFVIATDTSTQYPQYISFVLTQDKCGLLDAVNEGDEVKVNFNLRGREWAGPEGVRYFNSLEAWKIERVGAGQPAAYDGPAYQIHGTAMQQPAPGPSGPTAPVGEIISDLPF